MITCTTCGNIFETPTNNTSSVVIGILLIIVGICLSLYLIGIPIAFVGGYLLVSGLRAKKCPLCGSEHLVVMQSHVHPAESSPPPMGDPQPLGDE